MVGEVAADNLGFDNPLYQQIFDLYAQAVNAGEPLPDANFFALHSDHLLQNAALGMMMSTYSLSPNWTDKKTITVPDPEWHLGIEVEESILAYKKKKIEQRMADLQYRLRQCKDEDDQILLMAEYNELSKIRNQVGASLRQVVS